MMKLIWKSENERITEFYSKLVNNHGAKLQALDWGSQKSQELRFSILTQINKLDNASVLDVGCGLADLLEYLKSRGINVDYTGYDLTPEMIDSARQRFPYAHLEIRDLMAESKLKEQFDYVLASGIFYLRQVDPMAYLELMVRQMFTLCRRGIAFNTLSVLASEQNPDEFYADPERVLAMCLKITPRVVIRHDYLPHDFTVYLYKEEE